MLDEESEKLSFEIFYFVFHWLQLFLHAHFQAWSEKIILLQKQEGIVVGARLKCGKET